jgi:preprotein translocase subunit YajC
VFYFLLIRPQQKKQKQHREMLQALRRGDRVVTAGGIIGQITKVNSETELTLEIAESVRVKVVRGMISDILAKTEDPDDEDEENNEKESKSTKKDKKS